MPVTKDAQTPMRPSQSLNHHGAGDAKEKGKELFPPGKLLGVLSLAFPVAAWR